jgi:hypothetical protein
MANAGLMIAAKNSYVFDLAILPTSCANLFYARNGVDETGFLTAP